MPGVKFETADDEPLFPENDPLTISVPGVKGAKKDTPAAGGTFRCLDRANPPLERDGFDPEKQPVSYLVETLRLQIIPEERDAFEAAVVLALRENRVMADQLMKVARGIGDARRDAEQGTLARKVDRPTRAPRRSTR